MGDGGGLLIVVSGPSGVGKTTITRRLRERFPDASFSVSATTRPRTANETDGEDYHFLSEDVFKHDVNNGDMLEHAHVFGNFYGSPRKPVQAAIDAGNDVLFDIDWQGAQQIVNSSLGQNTLSIFILPPSIKELRRRLESRGQDSPETIGKRMLKSWDEISHWGSYDYVLVNDNLEQTFSDLQTIVTATRLRRLQQPGLVDHVRKLQLEFEDLT